MLEGGAIDHDGEGTILTTRQTLLNANRNGWTEQQAEAALREAFGAKKIIWIDEGLHNDHTDGHIDNLARFVGSRPRRLPVACRRRRSKRGKALEAIARKCSKPRPTQRDESSKSSASRAPALCRNASGEIVPASHMNFVIANGVVVVPVYGTPSAPERARKPCRRCFPTARSIGVPSRGLLGSGDAGGGSFHCITQQEPL